jgi:hypothetical protein
MFIEGTMDSIVIITIDIINNTRIPETTLFFFNVMPSTSVKKFLALYRPSRDINLFR